MKMKIPCKECICFVMCKNRASVNVQRKRKNVQCISIYTLFINCKPFQLWWRQNGSSLHSKENATVAVFGMSPRIFR